MKRYLKAAVSVVALAATLVMVLPVASFGVTSQAVYYPEDVYEPDDTPAQATVYEADLEVTYHNIHDATDVDWTKFSAEETGQPFLIETEPYAGRDVDLYMEVFSASDTVNKIAYNDDALWNTYGSQLFFEAPAPGDYYVKVSTLDDTGNGEIGWYKMTLSAGIARRIYGANRFDTAARVSKTIWPMTDLWGSYQEPVDANPPYQPGCIVVANGDNWPDALAGASFATNADGVLLLTHKDLLPVESRSEMDRLLTMAYGYDPAGSSYYGMRVYVLGGTGAVSQAIEDEIAGMDGVGEVVRLSGDSRYATAADIGYEFADFNGLGATPTAFVVSGASPWDALAAGPVAAYADAPVLMTGKSSVPPETLDCLSDLGIQRVVVVGGEAVVDSTAYAQLDSAVATVERVSGDSRYGTALAIAQWGVDNANMDPGCVTLVSGTSFPDGLSSAPISWYSGGPMLLTKGDTLADEVYQFFEDNGLPTAGSYVVGGPAVVNDDVYWEFKLEVWADVKAMPF